MNEWIETDGCGAMPSNIVTSMEPLTIVTVNIFPWISP
jgi:hypothetical protein